jgi:hypothetical protein
MSVLFLVDLAVFARKLLYSAIAFDTCPVDTDFARGMTSDRGRVITTYSHLARALVLI